jgi:hypothetical protein
MGKGTIGDRFPELLFLHSNSTSIDFADRDLHVRFFRVKDNITLDYDYKSSIADFLIRCSKEHVLDFGEKAATEIFYEGKPGMLLFVRNH